MALHDGNPSLFHFSFFGGMSLLFSFSILSVFPFFPKDIKGLARTNLGNFGPEKKKKHPPPPTPTNSPQTPSRPLPPPPPGRPPPLLKKQGKEDQGFSKNPFSDIPTGVQACQTRVRKPRSHSSTHAPCCRADLQGIASIDGVVPDFAFGAELKVTDVR